MLTKIRTAHFIGRQKNAQHANKVIYSQKLQNKQHQL